MLIKSSRNAVVIMLLVGVLAALGAACLPDNPYQRFQLLGVLYQRLPWIYERIHFDPKPINVAILGPSKTFMGVSGSEVEQRLSVLGKPASVANLSLVYQGRNAQWAILDELYKVKNPHIIVVAIDAKAAPWGHPWFMYFAPVKDLVFPPSIFLHDYLLDAAFLPFRQMELFAASLFPNVLGFRDAFDPVRYANTRNDFTTSFTDNGSTFVDMDRVVSAAKLKAELEEYKKTLHSPRLPRTLAPWVEADDRNLSRENRALGVRTWRKVVIAVCSRLRQRKTGRRCQEILQSIWNCAGL